MDRTLRRVLFAMLLGVALYAALVVYTGYHKIQDSLAQFHYSAFLAALALAFSNYVIRFFKWEYYLSLLDIRTVKKLDSFLIFLSGFVLTVTPGKVGEVFKSAVLARTHQIPLFRTAPIVVAERLTDVIGIIILISIGSTGFDGGLPLALAGSVLAGGAVLCVVWSKPVELVFALLNKTALRRVVPRLEVAYSSLRALASPRALLWPSLLSVAAWGAEGFALFVLLKGFGVSTGVSLPLFFYATSTLAGALTPLPGGLGVTDTMMQEQLAQIGHFSEGIATSSMIMVRFATLWWAVLVGLCALGLLRLRFPSALDSRDPIIS